MNLAISSCGVTPDFIRLSIGIEDVEDLEKARLVETARWYRNKYPHPLSILVRHHISALARDSWQAYHDLWIEAGVYLTGILDGDDR